MLSRIGIYRKTLLLTLAMIALGGVSASAQDSTTGIIVDGTVHSFPEIMILMAQSEITYDMILVPSEVIRADTSELVILKSGLYVGNDGKITQDSIPDSLGNLFSQAEDAYATGRHREASDVYRALAEMAPDVTALFTLVGDASVLAGDFDTAIVYLERGLEDNYHNYQTHWFLASAYWSVKRYKESLREIHLAHLLNPNHKGVLEVLGHTRRAMGGPKLESYFKPVYWLLQVDNKVRIESDSANFSEWVPYATVKAIWAVEPGYSQKMLGNDMTWVDAAILQEKEAVTSLMSIGKYGVFTERLVAEGYFEDFVIYEFLAQEDPALMLYLPPELLNHMADYLVKRHGYLALINLDMDNVNKSGDH